MRDALNQVDLCFVVDTTGSMGSFIRAAQQQLLATIAMLGADSQLDLRVGLIEYRDHPPQESSFVTRAHAFTSRLDDMQTSINKLKAEGGGDAPEAVYDGIKAACELKWREHSSRFLLLVGDAPPHGFKAASAEAKKENIADIWAEGCPCGLTAHSVTALAEKQRITVHALCMSNSRVTSEAFQEISVNTGGLCASVSKAEAVLAKIKEMLAADFGNLQFDREILGAIEKLADFDISVVAETVGCARLQAAAAVARLGRRGFL